MIEIKIQLNTSKEVVVRCAEYSFLDKYLVLDNNTYFPFSQLTKAALVSGGSQEVVLFEDDKRTYSEV